MGDDASIMNFDASFRVRCHHLSYNFKLRPSSGLIEYRISSGYTTNLDDRNFIEMSDQRLSAELQPPWGPTCVVCPQRTRTHAPLFLK